MLIDCSVRTTAGSSPYVPECSSGGQHAPSRQNVIHVQGKPWQRKAPHLAKPGPGEGVAAYGVHNEVRAQERLDTPWRAAMSDRTALSRSLRGRFPHLRRTRSVAPHDSATREARGYDWRAGRCRHRTFDWPVHMLATRQSRSRAARVAVAGKMGSCYRCSAISSTRASGAALSHRCSTWPRCSSARRIRWA